MKLSDLKKLLEKTQKIVQLEKEFELIPYRWQYLKTHFYFGSLIVFTSALSFIFAEHYLSLLSALVGFIFIANYHYSYRKWTSQNKKLVDEYAKLYRSEIPHSSVKNVTPIKIKSDDELEITIQKNHLALIKSDDLPS